jgi:hypothetical protein
VLWDMLQINRYPNGAFPGKRFSSDKKRTGWYRINPHTP